MPNGTDRVYSAQNFSMFGLAGRDKPPSGRINLDAELNALVRQENREGFLPNESLFEARFAAAEQRILGGLGVTLESYRAGQASRGVFSSGEATAAEFRDVRAPAVRELGEVRANLSLGFETLRLQQLNFLQQQKLQAVELALEKFLGEEAAEAARRASTFGLIGSVIGAGAGFLVAGPPGAMVGSQAGGSMAGGGHAGH